MKWNFIVLCFIHDECSFFLVGSNSNRASVLNRSRTTTGKKSISKFELSHDYIIKIGLIV